MAMVEVTRRCDFACPVCFADAGDQGRDPAMEDIQGYLVKLLDVAGGPVPLQISGGEPTLRDDLPAIIKLAVELGFRHIELITNGARIGENPDLLIQYRESGLKSVYLQFDGLSPDTHKMIRGRNLSTVRQRALEAIQKAGLCCTLAVTVVRGVNDMELGEIVRFALNRLDTIRAVSFQSARRFAGRFEVPGQPDGYGLSELIRMIAAQTGIKPGSFLSEGIGHSDCNALAYVYPQRERLMSLFDYLKKGDVRRFLGRNSRGKILAMFSGKKHFFFRYLLAPSAWPLLARATPIFGRNPLNVLRTRHLLIFAKSFMESTDMDPDRIDRCCYAIAGEKGVFSFCAYNNCHRF